MRAGRPARHRDVMSGRARECRAAGSRAGRRCLQRLAAGLLLAPWALALATPAVAAPLDVRNQHPVQLTLIHAPVQAATPPAQGHEASAQLHWTSLWLRPGRGADELATDGELLRLSLGGRWAIAPRWELAWRLPLLYASGGLLDPTIEDWHRLWGLPQNERTDFARDRYEVAAFRGRNAVSRGGRAYALAEDRALLGDSALFLSWLWPPAGGDTPPRHALRFGLEAPTADAEQGGGNGGWDAYLGLLSSGRWGTNAGRAWHVWAGHAWVHTPRAARAQGLDYADVASAGLAAEWPLAARWGLRGQLGWEQSTLRRLRDSHARRDQLLLWLGAEFALGAGRSLSLGFSEDLVADVSPDISFFIALRWQ